MFNKTTMGTFVYSYSLLSAYDITRETVYMEPIFLWFMEHSVNVVFVSCYIVLLDRKTTLDKNKRNLTAAYIIYQSITFIVCSSRLLFASFTAFTTKRCAD